VPLLNESSSSNDSHSSKDLRVLVVSPTGRDAELICDLLERASIDCIACTSIHEACDEFASGAAVGVFAEEALNPRLVSKIATMLQSQPPWSDFPLILLTVAGAVTSQSQQRRALREPLGNVLLLERPIRPETMISTVENALRARRRQYQIRDQLEQYRQAEEALRRSEKLAVTGRLAASIAHEINNPLESVINLLFLIQRTNNLSEIQEYRRLAEQELRRVTEITTQTLKFYREPMDHASTNIPEVIESVLALYQPKVVSRNVHVEKELEEGTSMAAGTGELRQVFANLIGNALDAMRAGGRLRIRARHARDYVDGERKGIRISIADTGTGIPAEIRDKIFEPFVSTKGDTGTGLGLWVTSEIVQKHRGTIHLRSSVEPRCSGTVFSVFLPLPESDGSAVATLAGAENHA
jgi:signal transduction histidine kinase